MREDTLREPGRPFEKTDVVFAGVEAYSFRHDSLVNILFDIREEPLADALREHWAEFEAGHRQSGWPPFWQGDESKTRERIAVLAEEGARWFEMTSSFGMEGWVLCRKVEYRTGRP